VLHNLTIQNSVFENNMAQYGGTMYHYKYLCIICLVKCTELYFSYGLFLTGQSQFSWNTTSVGGAIYTGHSESHITAEFQSNVAQIAGAFYVNFGNASILPPLAIRIILDKCRVMVGGVINNNSAIQLSGVYAYGDHLQFMNVQIIGNSATQNSSTIDGPVGETFVYKCTVINNTVPLGSSTFFPDGLMYVKNSTVQDVSNAQYCCSSNLTLHPSGVLCGMCAFFFFPFSLPLFIFFHTLTS
jgi:hypothetical protein